jgi:hypothetical protein
VDPLLAAVNVLYLGLWGSYFVAMILYYWSGLLPAAELIRWFRQTFGILAFNIEAIAGNPAEVFASRMLTFVDWAARTVWQDFISLSLVSSLLYLRQRRRKRA